MNGRKTNGGATFQASSGERKTKGRKTTLEALEAKIERAKDKVVRTKNAHESAVKELKELMDQRDLLRKSAIVELLMHSKRSYEEIEAFLKSDPNGHD